MFDLKQSIAEWRKQMQAAGIKTPVPLDELEIHLREAIERRIKSGLDEQRAFDSAAHEIGEAGALKNEFQKVRAGNWHHPLAWAAWGTFAISFFLPACNPYSNLHFMWGWQCAYMSATAVFWPETAQGDWGAIHLALLTLANLLMLASPFWLGRFSQQVNSLTWLRYLGFVALALVWSYLLLMHMPVYRAGGATMRVGCYLWALSFLLLVLSTFPPRHGRKQHV